MPVDQRFLGWQHLGPLWAVLGLSPALYAFAYGGLPFGASLGAIALGLLVAAISGLVLARSAARYGIGYAAVCRAAFGSRGALMPLTLRWIVGVVWVGGWAGALGGWLANLIAASAGAPALLQGDRTEYLGWALAAGCIVMAWWVVRGGMSRVVLFAVLGSGVAVCVSFGLIVFAGIASKGFGDAVGVDREWTAGEGAGAAGMALVAVIAGVVSSADWARFRRGGSGGREERVAKAKAFDNLAPLVMLPVGVGLAFVGALLASAASAVRGVAYAAAIPDAAGFGGIGGGALAAVFSLCMWLAAVPLVGIYSPALAACGMWPRRVGYHRALAITLIASISMVPTVTLVTEEGMRIDSIAVALGPIFGVLIIDEVVLRRGRVILDELYRHSTDYGPILGTTLSAFVGVVAGWLLHPEVLPRLARRLPESGADLLGRLGVVPPAVTGALGGALVAAVIYLAFAPLERWVMSKLRGIGQRRRERRDELEEPAFLSESSETAGLTNPHWSSEDSRRGK